MIHSLAIKNFSSFREPVLIEFTVGKQAGERSIFLDSAQEGVLVNSVTGVFGANASGKTNLLKAIAFIRDFILHSASERPNATIPIEPFVFTEEEHEKSAVSLMLEFEYDSKLYRYELEVTTRRVLAESLHRKDQRFRYLFERVWNEETSEYILKAQDIGPARVIAQRENASFLGSAVLQEHEFASYIARYFEQCYVNIHSTGRLSSHDPETMNVLKATRYYDVNSDCLRIAEKHLSEADLGISGVSIEKVRQFDEQGKETTTPFPYAQHRVNGKIYRRALLQESRGTQALFVLLRYILPVLETGGVAVIDEFETGLHPHVVKYVVELFYSRETNPLGAQLIANFHTDYLLQTTLEKYQIMLTEKDSDSQSTDVWRLDKIKGAARNTNNHYAKYHAGVYGGIPNL